MNIGIDVDDVLAEFQHGWMAYHNETYGTNMTYDALIDYNYTVSFNIPAELVLQRVHDFYETEGFENLEPVIDSIEFIKELSKNHNLFAITARPNSTVEISKIWIKKYYGEVFRDIIFCNHYSKDPNVPKQLKSDICKLYNITLMIEDGLHNATDVASCGTKVLLFDKPWNRELIEHKNIVRVSDWKEIFNHIKNHKIRSV